MNTWLQSPVFHSTGQSIILQNCWARGGGCGQRSAPTGSVLLPPRATSWIQSTWRVWTPPPHVRLQMEKSDVFQRGGHGTSLHVRVIASGRRSIGHKCGLTRWPSCSRTHSIIDSWTPEENKQEIQFKNPVGRAKSNKSWTSLKWDTS